MNLGLLGGTFNPVHNAHLAIADEAVQVCGLDRLLLLPAPLPPHKMVEGAVSYHHRRAMVALAIAGRPQWAVSDIESRRHGPSYTVDTLAAVQAQWPQARLFFIIGDDSFRDLPTWKDWLLLFDRASLVVATRPGVETDRRILAPVAIDPRLCYDSKVPEIPCKSGHSVVFLTRTHLAFSSSEIRQRIAAGQTVADSVPAPVAAYINQHQLYR